MKQSPWNTVRSPKFGPLNSLIHSHPTMPRPPKHRPWHEADLGQLRYHFLDGASLEDLVTRLKRPAKDIIDTLRQEHLLMVRKGNYYRVHPTPFAPCPQHQAPSPQSAEPSPQRTLTVDDLELPIRCFNVLKNSGIQTVVQLCEYTEAALLKLPNMGRRSVREIIETLEDRGFELAPCSKP